MFVFEAGVLIGTGIGYYCGASVMVGAFWGGFPIAVLVGGARTRGGDNLGLGKPFLAGTVGHLFLRCSGGRAASLFVHW